MEFITYRTDAELTAHQLADLFKRSGIRRPTEDLGRIERMLLGADLIITAWQGELLVGVARSLTDLCYVCYLADLAVDKALQKQGIGRELVGRTREIIGDEVTLILLSAPGAMEYYPKIGFDPVKNGWIINRLR